MWFFFSEHSFIYCHSPFRPIFQFLSSSKNKWLIKVDLKIVGKSVFQRKICQRRCNFLKMGPKMKIPGKWRVRLKICLKGPQKNNFIKLAIIEISCLPFPYFRKKLRSFKVFAIILICKTWFYLFIWSISVRNHKIQLFYQML